jgi:mannose-1-phosphate guanylyltransferase/mannose-6-phosphate isomerase
MDRRIIPLIMCGGAGTQLWPASRELRPKQFLPLFGTRSTSQETLLRVSDASLFERPIVITNNAYRFMVLEQLAEIGLEADVLLEPMRRDPGPAIAAGAAFALTRDKDSDHVVRDSFAFVAACREGLKAAEAGHIVTFGSSRNVPPLNMAISAPATASPVRSARSRNSSKSRMLRPQRSTSRLAISGTAATSCSARPCCRMNTAISTPTVCRP